MPENLMCCASLPDATITSVPIYDFAIANEEVAKLDLEEYFPCCGKSSCGGCVHSFRKLKTFSHVRFANPNEVTKQMKSKLKKY
jgi:hypothetical protein